MPLIDIFFQNRTLLVSSFWVTGGFYLLVLVLLAASAFIFHKIKIRDIKGKKAEVESQLAQCSELMRYAKIDQQKAREETEAANKNKSELLATLSREMRTPMNAMWGMASLLNETNLSMEQREYTKTILNSGERLIALINEVLTKDILQHSKTETAKELESKDFDLSVTIEEVLDVFAVKASQTGLDLLYSIDESVPANVVGDVQHLRQVLLNLVENAFRFTSAGEIAIGVRLSEPVEGSGMALQFDVRDTGKGMSAAKLHKVCDDLAQPESSDELSGGIGLTLITCKRLIKKMGGTLTAESVDNEGAVFKFSIAAAESQKPARTRLQTETPDLRGKKVLIADDNMTSAVLLKTQLERWNAKTVIAGSGREAREILSTDTGFNLVLADLSMPGMDGIALAREIRQIDGALPVILMNKTGDESFRQHASLFTAVINKPIRKQMLAKEVMEGLRIKGINEPKVDNKLSADFSERCPLRILIAEDDAMNQKMVTMVLKKLGYIPVIASNGKEVLEIVSQRAFDLILMDVQMPEMDGLEATRMIRLCLSSQPVIVAMTANTLQGDREDCMEAGMDDYLSKPIKLPALVEILQKWAMQKQQTQLYAELV